MPPTTPEGAAHPDDGATPLRRRVVDALLADNLLVVVILVLAVFLLVIGRTLLGVDSWLTLVSGREIAQHGLPRHEVLTTIAAGRTWTDQQWLAQLVYYGLDRSGGLGLAVLAHAFFVSSALAITVVASRVRGASSRMTLVAAAVCLVVAPWSWQLRAQSIALPLFALTLALVSTDPRLAARRTFLVFPTLVLWANVHGSVVLGALIVSLAAIVAAGSGRRQREPLARRLLLYLIAPWACVLASPYGTDLAAYYRLLLVDSPVSRHITEWQAPRPEGYLLVFFAVAVAAVAIVIWQRRRLSLLDLVVLGLTLAGALRSVRAVVWFSLALAMLLPLALDGIVRPNPSPPVHRRLAALLTGALVAVLAAAAIVTVSRSDAWFERGWSTGSARAAARAVSKQGPGTAVWASGTYADWLLWKEPSLRGHLAWDARFELLTEQELRALVLFNAQKPGWRNPVRPYPILVLDRRRDGPQARALLRNPTVRAIFADRWAVVLTRASP